jgi:hypothetical protein
MNSTKCAHCGLVNFVTAAECKRCHTSLSEEGVKKNAETSASVVNPLQHQSTPFGVIPRAGFAEPENKHLYYKPSGAITTSGVVLGLLGGLLVGVISAFVYSYIISYLPFVYLTFLCTIGYAIVLGVSVGQLMKWGNNRNSSVCLLVSIVVTFVSYYFSWAVWLSVAVSSDQVSVSSLTLAQQPLLLWDVLLRVNEIGAWAMQGATFSGFALWAVWLIEALIIMIASPVIAWSALTSDPFCEACETWCVEEKKIITLGEGEPSELKRRFEAKDFEYLKSLGPRAEKATAWYSLDLYNCPSCNTSNALSVWIDKIEVDSKGKSKVKSISFVSKLLLNTNEVSHLRRVGTEMTQTRKAA